ncbi:MAG: transposase [Hyphomonadaceae bacterium]|nr:transposase [Hyphomonadaceae bacterium]
MARQSRIVVVGAPHHVTQRGNRRQTVFFSDADYVLYLQIAAACFAESQAEVWGYCLMPNHVHLIVAPQTKDALRAPLSKLHARYARAINARERWTGHLWQSRFASFPMDEPYFIQCARYVGLNPVRAGLVARASDWAWSSVRAHLAETDDALVRIAKLKATLGAGVQGFFTADVAAEARKALRRASATGRPLGASAWVKALEKSEGRVLAPRAPGRPRRSETAHAI